jgi:hypothetical protein
MLRCGRTYASERIIGTGGDRKATHVGKVFRGLRQVTQFMASYKSSLSSSSVPKSMSALPSSESISNAFSSLSLLPIPPWSAA